MDWLSILAQAATQPATPRAQPGLLDSLPLFLAFGLIIWLFVLRPKSTEQRKFKEMMSSLKKGDRIMTIGGIIGTIVSLTDDEVTIKIDESTNTKMTLVRSAVKMNYSAAPPSSPQAGS